MKWLQLPLGSLQTNCYVLYKEDGTCLIVDPGAEGARLVSYLKENKLTPVAIVLTHAHFDHIGAVDDVRNAYQIPVYIHQNEQEWLGNAEYNGSQSFRMGIVKVAPADVFFTKEEELTIGSFTFQLLETPGHSPGSVSFYFQSDSLVLAGDALFNGSIGRTDLRDGDYQTLISSIHTKLLTLPEETLVLSGHGPVTTIGQEMDSNPFLNGF